MGRYVNQRYKTKRRTRDLDKIFGDDMKSDETIVALENQKFDEEKPGLAQFYCIPCAKYFETEIAKRTHQRGKVHKRRLKELKEGPYTIEEANAAAGLDVAKYQQKKEMMQEKQQVPQVKQVLSMPPKSEKADVEMNDSKIDTEAATSATTQAKEEQSSETNDIVLD